MARPKIKNRAEIKKMLTISIEEKWLSKYDKNILKEVAYNAIIRYNEINDNKINKL